MRCEDYLPLIEEYFDGEADERIAEQIGAHLATCADCAAVLDALSFEQEIYARYDRGLEVSPSLWSGVSAEINGGAQPRPDTTRQSFLSRLRNIVAASLAAFTLRPALVSSLALLVVSVAVGSVWLAHRHAPAGVAVATANKQQNVVATPSPTNQVQPVETGGGGESKIISDVAVAGPGPIAEAEVKRGVPRASSKPVEVETLVPDDPQKAIDYKPQLGALTKGTVNISADDHAGPDNPVEIADVNYRPDDAESAPMLDPAQKEFARHVEQTQMLLRSIKNARASDEGTVNVSYERKLSRRLLAENATLRLDAETRGDKGSKQMLDQIEPFLLDIANMSDNASREEVHSVKERMKRNEIIAALQVY
ncbi:MAG TPA: zf-HC2 domain-containing protein [Pyrinomonadaceae bacterium]|nr:zf-HC2 domain-containing protein [Pyrinomonadaceae bacterium]